MDQPVDDHTILQVVVGSRAFGLSGAASDTDRRGVYALPASAFWGLRKPARHHDGPLDEQVRWEVERVCTLGLAANPTVLRRCTLRWSKRDPTGRGTPGAHAGLLVRRVADTYPVRHRPVRKGRAGIARAAFRRGGRDAPDPTADRRA